MKSGTLRTFFIRVASSASAIPSPLHKPRMVMHWLASAVRSNLLSILVTVAIAVAAVLVGDAVLDRMFAHSSFTDKVAGAFGAKSDSERKQERAGRALRLLVYAAGIGFVSIRLLLEAPAAVERAAKLSRARPDRDGLVSGRFALAEKLGQGATGAVFRAQDVVLGRSIALKELRLAVADEDSSDRFRREAKILARLNHPGIVQVYDFLEHRGRVWIAMELVEGGDLATMLRRRRKLSADKTALLGERMAKALAFAHSRDVVHRDLKPLNILLVDDETPKITDFGLAKLTGSSAHTAEGTILGTPHYMSPEQADGRQVDSRSDIYSLGCVFYHMLSGHPPFEGELASVLMQHLRRNPPPLGEASDGVPAAMDDLVLSMLAKSPADRPLDMDEVSSSLRHSAAVR